MRQSSLYCKSIALRALPEFIRTLGGNPEQLFMTAGLDIDQIKTSDFYNWINVCTLFNLIEREFDITNLGIRFAYAVPKDFLNSGPMLILAALVPTMREWFALSKRYQTLHVNSFAYHYQENSETNEVECEIQIHPLSPPCQQFIEHVAAMIALMVEHHFGRGHFKRMSFQHKPPADLSWHEKTFNCPIEFNADKNKIYMPLEFMDTKLGGQLRSLRPIVKSYMDRKVIKNPLFDSSMRHTVERLLPSIFGIRKSSQADVAEILGVSPKKLQRLLSDEGVNFSDILNPVRHGMAKRLLFESDISIAHLAMLLDYASPTAFNTACQRWVGVSPRQYRKDLRAAGR